MGRRIQSLRAFRRAWGNGLRPLAEERLEAQAEILDRGRLGCRCLWEVSSRCPGVPFWRPGGLLEEPRGGPKGPQGGSGGVLEASWRRVGAIKKAWSAKGGLQGLPGRSWERLGALLGASWSALGPSWRPPGRPKAAPNPKWRYRGLLNRTSLI